MEETNHSVNLGTHTCCSWLTSEQTNLSEEISALEQIDKGVTFVIWILNENLTFSSLDEEETVVVLTLVHQWVLWIEKHQLERLDKEVNKCLFLIEEGTFFGNFFEYQLDDLIPQGRRKAAVEVPRTLR